jgi:uncharacterized membrane-anchored protein YjiN (DUF445 family)
MQQKPSGTAVGGSRMAALYDGEMNETDPDTMLRRQLARYRAFATGLLLLMAAIAVAGYALPLNDWTGLFRDAGRAGFIGGVADWFAVTALFRHPLGLPIPHTAIIPAQRERLGAALGRFVATHVFTEADVKRFLGNLDSPGILQRFLNDPEAVAPLAGAMAGMLPKLLASIEDGRARKLLARILPRLVGGKAASVVVARALAGLVEGGRHQEVFSFIIQQLKETLLAREEILKEAIKERVREQGGRLVGWAIGASVAQRVMKGINLELERVSPDSSEMRDAFDEWARREIGRLETDPARAAELAQAMKGVLTHESVQAWAWDVWARLRMALERDATLPAGRTVAVIESGLASLGDVLGKDPEARARVNLAIEGIVLRILPVAQGELAGFIGKVIGQWDTATITEKFELRVGKDLQYIRVNGTLVGFVLGAVIYGVTLLAGPR